MAESDTTNYDSGVEEMGLLRGEVHEAGMRRAAITRSAVFMGLFGVFYFVAGATFLAKHGDETGAREPKPLTVRSLLESETLTDVATNNLLLTRTVQGERPAVKALVREGFMNISNSIEKLYPNAHRKMDQLRLSKEQEEAALAGVKKFGDWRAIKLTKTITDAIGEARKANESSEQLKERMMRALAPSFEHLKQIHHELKAVQESSKQGGLHIAPSQVVENVGEIPSRRLLESQALPISNGVRVHARHVFHSLESQLGDDMPTAPSRMLSIFDSDDDGYNSRRKSNSKGSTIACVQEAMPNPLEMAECVVRGVPNLMDMLEAFMKKMHMN